MMVWDDWLEDNWKIYDKEVQGRGLTYWNGQSVMSFVSHMIASQWHSLQRLSKVSVQDDINM